MQKLTRTRLGSFLGPTSKGEGSRRAGLAINLGEIQFVMRGAFRAWSGGVERKNITRGTARHLIGTRLLKKETKSRFLGDQIGLSGILLAPDAGLKKQCLRLTRGPQLSYTEMKGRGRCPAGPASQREKKVGWEAGPLAGPSARWKGEPGGLRGGDQGGWASAENERAFFPFFIFYFSFLFSKAFLK